MGFRRWEFKEIGKEIGEFGGMRKSAGKIYDYIQRIEKLALKIFQNNNAYRARHLIEILKTLKIKAIIVLWFLEKCCRVKGKIS
ncbi:MAG: hypothetical protein ABEJ02_01650 [Candidatus Paceibacteria bacterium]